ncbi:MAG: DUF3899 domain-containing protein [Bacilli bacterium]|nr:DUF3899 domain-containing protein [Bacilli bacterium]
MPPPLLTMSDRAKQILITWIVATALAGVYFLLLTFIPRNFTLMGWTNTFFLTGAFTLLTGGLYVVYYFGAFEMFQYGFMQMFHYMIPNPGPMKHKDFAEYREYRTEKRKKSPLYPWPWVVYGAIFMLSSLIFRLQLN